MPKKRTFNFKTLQGRSSSNTSSSSSSKDVSSVNERLSELRKLEARDAAAKNRQLAESVNQRSVPPEIRGVLGVPESAPPKPKVGNGLRMRERMRTPGPAPPKSWLAGRSTVLPFRGIKRRKNVADEGNRSRPTQLLRFARLTGLDDGTSVDERPASLSHLALKTIATSWDLLDEDDYPALADIPLTLRLRLISYISKYGPAMETTALQALLQGSEGIPQLDLAGFLGHGKFSLKKVTKILERAQHNALDRDLDNVVESWDAEDSSPEAPLQPALRTSHRFTNLTHLCLSHPAPTVSWRDFLALSRLTPKVTHLSLAYWPRPTLTPNLSTTSVSSQHSPDVNAGGSHYYSSLDQDMSEPASLLRQLSGNLLCLQWLDLEGCSDWIPALEELLAGAKIVVPTDQNRTTPTDNWRDWITASNPTHTVFTTNWKNLTYLRCYQGWIPSFPGIEGLSDRRQASTLHAFLFDGIRKHLKGQAKAITVVEPMLSQDVYDVEKRKARLWLETEYKSTYACMQVNSARRSGRCKVIDVDFGWIQRIGGRNGEECTWAAPDLE